MDPAEWSRGGKWRQHALTVIKMQYAHYAWVHDVEGILAQSSTHLDELNLRQAQRAAESALLDAREWLQRSAALGAGDLLQQQLDACDVLAEASHIVAVVQQREDLRAHAAEWRRRTPYDVKNYFTDDTSAAPPSHYGALSSQTQQQQQQQQAGTPEEELAFAYACQYAAVVRCLAEQLSDIAHPLCRIKNKFCEVTVQRFRITQPAHGAPPGRDPRVTKCIEDIRAFKSLFVEMMRAYYLLDELALDTGELFFNTENLTNLAYSLLFQNSSLYLLAMRLFENEERDLQAKYDAALPELANALPHDFGGAEVLQSERLVQLWSSYPTQSSSSFGAAVQQQYNEPPFHAAVRTLSELEKQKVPLQKLKLLLTCCEQLNAALNDALSASAGGSAHAFAPGGGSHNRQTHRLIELSRNSPKRAHVQNHFDGDNLLALFIYLVARAQISGLYQHYALMDHFVERGASSSNQTSYLLTTLLGAIHLIAHRGTQKRAVASPETFASPSSDSRRPAPSEMRDLGAPKAEAVRELDDLVTKKQSLTARTSAGTHDTVNPESTATEELKEMAELKDVVRPKYTTNNNYDDDEDEYYQ